MPPEQRKPKAKKSMKKPKLLANLIGEEKRRHHVAAFVTEEGEWNQHEPNTGLARMFIVMLVLHVFVIGGIILYDFVGEEPETQSTPVVAKQNDSVPSAIPVQPSPAPDSPSPIGLSAVNGITDPAASTTTDTSLPVTNAQPLPPIATVPPPAITPGAPSVTHPQLADLPSTTDATIETATDTASAPLPEPVTAPVEPEAAASLADVPPATTLVAKTENPAPAPEPKVEDAPPSPRKTEAAPGPKPVPPPSEMAKRPTTPAAKPAPKQTTKPTTKSTTKPSTSRGGSHVLAKGETLYRIAAKYGTTPEKIMKANNIKDPAKLRDGTRLVIPGK